MPLRQPTLPGRPTVRLGGVGTGRSFANRLPAYAAAVAAALALGALTGWALGVPWLHGGRVGGTAPSTALGLLLAALALAGGAGAAPRDHAGDDDGGPTADVTADAGADAGAGAREWAALVAALLALGTGFVALVAYAAGARGHPLDALLLAPSSGSTPSAVSPVGLPPARMAPNTALALSLLGAALAGLAGERATRRPLRPLATRAVMGYASGALALAALALVGHLYGVAGLYAVGGMARLSPLTAVALAALAVGTLFARPGHGLHGVMAGADAGAVLARRFLPLVLLAPIAVGAARLAAERAGLVTAVAGTTTRTVVEVVLLLGVVLATARRLRLVDAERERLLAEARANERRTAALQQVTTALNAALSVDDVAGVVRDQIGAALGLRDAALVDADAPAPGPADAARTLDVPLATGPAGARRAAGALRLVLAGPRSLDAGERAFLDAVAAQTAQALERARLFAAEARARADAEEANRSKAGFLANMSHELRTPLNAIGGHVQLLELGIHGPLDPAQHAALARVQAAQRHLLALINDVLNFAKLEAGRVEYVLGEVHVGELVAELRPLVEPQAAARGLQLEVSLPAESDAPPVRVLADRQKLGQVLLNLLSNAVKFTPPTRPDGTPGRVRVELLAAGAPGAAGAAAASPAGRVRICVHDTGIGIPADRLEAIFEPFVQVHAGLTRTHEGTGLGLAISRDLVRGMGGELRVRSREGEGSTFTVELPLPPTRPDAIAERRLVAGDRRRELERRRGSERRRTPRGAAAVRGGERGEGDRRGR